MSKFTITTTIIATPPITTTVTANIIITMTNTYHTLRVAVVHDVH